MITRIGNAGDFEAVVPMMRQHRQRQQHLDPALYELHPQAERRFRRWIGEMAEDPRSLLLIAEEEGRTIGFLYALLEKDPPIYLNDEYAIVREWWVEAAFRGRGVGKALVERAATELAAAGVPQLRVRIAATDQPLQATLARCGFRAGAAEMVMELTPPH
jgi:GNAT superfamily N-acetyltransferase